MAAHAEFSSVPPLPDFLPPEDDTSGAMGRTLPGLPGPLPVPQPIPIPSLHNVRCGCWLLSYRPQGSSLVAYDGTMRVECHSAGRTASGDLYQRPVILLPPIPVPVPIPPIPPRPPLPSRPILLAGPNPAQGIPILARSRYRYYVRVTSLPERFYIGGTFSLGFELWRYTAPNSWALESTSNAKMMRMPAPAGYPSPADYAEGDVRNAAGSLVGRLTMGWVSKYFRRCTIEIDTVAGSERPVDGGGGHSWATVMDQLGWQAAVQLGDTNVVEPSGNSWSDAEMHAAMLARRAATNLDTDWHYHILAVKNIDSTPRGIMYDVGGTDSNHMPREGVGISTHWTIDPTWGTVGGQRFGAAAAPYFRTAVHELGHAMGLFHNFADHGFMCTSDVIAAAGTPAMPFPSNIQWSYHADNLKQLRHYPDPFVRPGSVAFGGASTVSPPITPTDLEVSVEELALVVTPLLGEVPLGAPVRVGYTLTNRGTQPLRVPQNLGLKGEFISGRVVDPAGQTRSFRTVVHCLEDCPFITLAPGQSVSESATLMRGAEGALFPSPGVHEVQIELHWDTADMVATVHGSTTVMVTGAVDALHAAAAHRVLATPDTHLVLAIGGDHLVEGVQAIRSALDSPVLRPHFAAIEAKRIGKKFRERAPDLKRAAALVDVDAVLSDTEIKKLEKIAGDSAGGKDLAKALKAKSKDMVRPIAAQQAVDAV